jgi:hypothetical protein
MTDTKKFGTAPVFFTAIINNHSEHAALTIIGFRHETLKNKKGDLFKDYDKLGTVLFVNSHDQKDIS